MELDRFHFTGLDVSSVGEMIEVSMEDYAKSLKGIPEIRKADWIQSLSELELKMYQKMTGKISRHREKILS